MMKKCILGVFQVNCIFAEKAKISLLAVLFVWIFKSISIHCLCWWVQLGRDMAGCTVGSMVVNHLCAVDLYLLGPSLSGLQCLLNICVIMLLNMKLFFIVKNGLC